MASNITTQSVLKEISHDHLECPICSERFKQPKLLECSHSFCLECLQQLRQKGQSSTKLSCPVCRQETLLKQNGIDGLKTNFIAFSLTWAIEEKECHLKQQQEKQEPSQEFVSKCSKHTGKDHLAYCETCNKLICITCIAKDHRRHPVIELNEASDKSKQHATELLANIRESIKTFNISIQEIDTSRMTLDSMFAATKEKISKKADEEIAKEVARIREEKHKLIKIVHHIERLLQDLKEYREMKSTKVPNGLTYMDFKEGQKSLGRLVLKNKWTLKTEMKTTVSVYYVSAYSNSDIVVSNGISVNLIPKSADMAESNPQSTLIVQELTIKGLTRPSKVTVNKNDELIVLDNETVKIFNRNYQLLHQFNPGSKPSCIAVDDNNLIAVGYSNKEEISLHKPDGSLIRTLPAPGIGYYLTTCTCTYKEQLIYTKWEDKKLVSVDYNGRVVFSVGINQSGMPRGVCCDKDGSIFVAVWREPLFISGNIHHYSPDGKYIGCIIKDCGYPRGLTFTPAGDLVVTTQESVQIYQHE